MMQVLGPVVCLATFRTAMEAVAIANHTHFGMAASVWTENVSLALETASHLKVGTVWVNSHNTADAAAGAGGGKRSGSGRVGGRRVRVTIFSVLLLVCVCFLMKYPLRSDHHHDEIFCHC